MSDEARRPSKSEGPEFAEVVDRYTPEIRHQIVTLIGVTPERQDLLLSRVIHTAGALIIEFDQQDHFLLTEQRNILRPLRNALGTASARSRALPDSTRRVIELQAKIEHDLAIEEASSFVRLWKSSTSREGSKGDVRHTTPGRPADPNMLIEWVRTGAGPFLTNGGEELVENAFIMVEAFYRWTSVALESIPAGAKGRPPEIIMRNAIRRLSVVWEKYTKAEPDHGDFRRFADAVLNPVRPLLPKPWDRRSIESAVREIVGEARSSRKPRERNRRPKSSQPKP